MNKTQVKRNGAVDLMSFVFCIVLILADFAAQFKTVSFKHFTFFAEGRVAVDFFLLVAGALTAASAKRHTDGTLVKQTRDFMGRRLLRILPYHLIVFCVAFVWFLYQNRHLAPDYLVDGIIKLLPNLFFIQKTGLKEAELLPLEWWIAGLLWMLLLIYPLVLRFKGYFTKIAAPFLAVLLIGYIAHETGELGNVDAFLYLDTVSKVYLRCFAGLCGGVFAYEMACGLQKLRFTKLDRVLLTGAELLAYGVTLLYMCYDFPARYEPYAFYALFFGVMLTFSHQSVLADVLDNQATTLLGKSVLPLYFGHMLPLLLLDLPFIRHRRYSVKLLFVLAVTVILAGIAELAVRFMMKKIAFRSHSRYNKSENQ